jgi:hypothetical protein
MPETVIMQCSDGTDPRGPLPACMPMEFGTWYGKQKKEYKLKIELLTPVIALGVILLVLSPSVVSSVLLPVNTLMSGFPVVITS